ncbi:MAG: DUF6291 domain-containing protein [Bacilli bacterium]|nr:DUF6291 domain-containing protein [Bacilli bacterium]
MDKKNSFIMYLNYEDNFKLLSDKELGILMRGIFQYVKTGKEPNFNNVGLKMAFSFIKTNIDLDAEKYKKKCEKNRDIARRRWEEEERKKTERENTDCHLGSSFKNESCFKCLKKNKCTLPTSPEFKLTHNCSFKEWNEKVNAAYEEWCKDRAEKGEETKIELFDYDWLADD